MPGASRAPTLLRRLPLQAEVKQVKQSEPALLQTPEAQARITSMSEATAVLHQRSLAVAQLEDLVHIARSLGEGGIGSGGSRGMQAGAAWP